VGGFSENASHDAHTDYLTKLINSLVNTYKTPEVLRHKADQLAAWRKDAEATNMVGRAASHAHAETRLGGTRH
jgi:hypothetical protein